jgi:hypothetical protein
MTTIERRLARLEAAVMRAPQRSYAERLHAALDRVRLGLPARKPPMVNPEDDPLGARMRWVWEWQRDGKAPYYPGP